MDGRMPVGDGVPAGPVVVLLVPVLVADVVEVDGPVGAGPVPSSW